MAKGQRRGCHFWQNGPGCSAKKVTEQRPERTEGSGPVGTREGDGTCQGSAVGPHARAACGTPEVLGHLGWPPRPAGQPGDCVRGQDKGPSQGSQQRPPRMRAADRWGGQGPAPSRGLEQPCLSAAAAASPPFKLPETPTLRRGPATRRESRPVPLGGLRTRQRCPWRPPRRTAPR